MAWVKIDDQFADHPKVREVGPIGMAIQIAALCYCNRFLTDGLITKRTANAIVLGLSKDKKWPQRMVASGLWDEHPEGYIVHDYLEYNPSKANVLAKKEQLNNAQKLAAKATNEKRYGHRWNSDASSEQDLLAPVPVPLPKEAPKISKALEGYSEEPSKTSDVQKPPMQNGKLKTPFVGLQKPADKPNGQFQPWPELKQLANDLLKAGSIYDKQDRKDVSWDVYYAVQAGNEQEVHTLIAEIKAREHDKADNIVAVIRARLMQLYAPQK